MLAVQAHAYHRRHHERIGYLMRLDEIQHLLGIKQGNKNNAPTIGPRQQDPEHRSGMEHRRLHQVGTDLVIPNSHGPVIHVEHLGPMLDQHTLGQPGGAAGIHQHHGIGLIGFVTHNRLSSGQQRFVSDIVRSVAVPDQDHLPDRVLSAHYFTRRGDQWSKQRIGENDFAGRVLDDIGEFGRSQPQVQRIDHASPHERSMPKLQILMTIEGENGKAIFRLDSQLNCQSMSETSYALVVLMPVAPIVAVDNSLDFTILLNRRPVHMGEDQFLHGFFLSIMLVKL